MEALLASLRQSIEAGRKPVSLRDLQFARHAIKTPLSAPAFASLMRDEHRV